jgi:hypothetical protein
MHEGLIENEEGGVAGGAEELFRNIGETLRTMARRGLLKRLWPDALRPCT